MMGLGSCGAAGRVGENDGRNSCPTTDVCEDPLEWPVDGRE